MSSASGCRASPRSVTTGGTVVAAVSVDTAAVESPGPPRQGDHAHTLAATLQAAAIRFSRAEVEAITDGLTGLYNHRYLHERLEEELVRARGREGRLSVLFCDCDHFKAYNDEHGHKAGDAALARIARIIEACGRRSDLAARYGGEEFVLALTDTDLREPAPWPSVCAPRSRPPAPAVATPDHQHRYRHLPRRRPGPRRVARQGRLGDVHGQARRAQPGLCFLRRPGAQPDLALATRPVGSSPGGAWRHVQVMTSDRPECEHPPGRLAGVDDDVGGLDRPGVAALADYAHQSLGRRGGWD